MNRKANTLIIAALALFAASPVFAGHDRCYSHRDHHGHGRIHQRLDRQHSRIEQGIGSGELTRWETRKLMKQQRRIRHLAREFRADGHLSHKERDVLGHKLDKASDRIWRFKHNDEYRYSHRHEDRTYQRQERVSRSEEQAQSRDENKRLAAVRMLNSDPMH